METDGSPQNVVAGLDPAIHPLEKTFLDGCAGRPNDDAEAL